LSNRRTALVSAVAFVEDPLSDRPLSGKIAIVTGVVRPPKALQLG
jgi:hypothetical protein